MKDYWKNLPYRAKLSKIERFNWIMAYINGEINESDESTVEDEEEVEDELHLSVVHVSVVDSDNSPIGSVDVTISDENNTYTGTTGVAGGCNIRDVPYGEYVINAHKEGYEDTSDTLIVNDGEVESELILNEVST